MFFSPQRLTTTMYCIPRTANTLPAAQSVARLIKKWKGRKTELAVSIAFLNIRRHKFCPTQRLLVSVLLPSRFSEHNTEQYAGLLLPEFLRLWSFKLSFSLFLSFQVSDAGLCTVHVHSTVFHLSPHDSFPQNCLFFAPRFLHDLLVRTVKDNSFSFIFFCGKASEGNVPH